MKFVSGQVPIMKTVEKREDLSELYNIDKEIKSVCQNVSKKEKWKKTIARTEQLKSERHELETNLRIYPVGSLVLSWILNILNLYIASIKSIKSKVTIGLFWKKTSAQTNHMRYLKFVCKNWYLWSNENTSFKNVMIYMTLAFGTRLTNI